MADKAAIRAELDATRDAFETLAKSLSSADWKRKSGNRAWNVGQLMSHLASAVSPTAGSINMVRIGKGFNPPSVLYNLMNMLVTRIGARKATPDSVVATYNAGHARLIDALESIEDDEWEKTARFFGKTETMESLLRSVISHFQEHEADIKRGLDRPSR